MHLSAPLVARISLLLTEDLHRTAVAMDLAPELLAEFREPHPAQRLETVFATAEKTAEIICAEAAAARNPAADNVSRSLVEYVNTHIFDPELSLKQLGDEFSVSTASVSRIFKKSAGENFYHYITQKRIARAQELLLIQGYCPAQIAEAVGYDSEYSFKRAFVRTVGMARATTAPKTAAIRPPLKGDYIMPVKKLVILGDSITDCGRARPVGRVCRRAGQRLCQPV